MLTPTLKNGIGQMMNVNVEAQAIATFVDAYIQFVSTATAGIVPIVPAALQTAPKVAMIGAMSGLSKNGAQAIQAGVAAFWAACVPLAATLFPTALLLTPPAAVAGLSGLLTGVFTANTQGQLPLDACAQNMATAIFTGSQGGTVTLPPSVITPIT